MEQRQSQPYIYAVLTVMLFAAVDLLSKIDERSDFHPFVMVGIASMAILSVVLIVTGLRWREPIMGHAVERFGQYLLAAMWLADIVAVLYVRGPELALFIPVMFLYAALHRAHNLRKDAHRRVESIATLEKATNGHGEEGSGGQEKEEGGPHGSR